MPKPFHAFCLAAPHSGGGKTTIALALMRAFRNRGLTVQGFKCGPDYIDPSFHRQATGRISPNLDTWMMGGDGVRATWSRHATEAAKADMAICEGVMGLFDSRRPGDMAGSTADCALALDLPVLLIVNARGMAGSIAPLVAGFRDFHPRIRIAGIIANKVGSPRHARMLADALEQDGLPPLLGALPHKSEWTMPERQLGLVPAEESECHDSWFDMMGQAAEEYIDLERVLELTRSKRPDTLALSPQDSPSFPSPRKRLGIARDEAFRFYYEDNLAFLEKQGWELVEFSPLRDSSLPENLNALYLGGGYPEVFARELGANATMKAAIRSFADSGKEIFAECGGYMYLGKNLITRDGAEHAMCGVINGTSRMGNSLRSLGYRETSFARNATPSFLPGSTLRGHEFHWSDMELHEPFAPLYSFIDRDGNTRHEGVCRGNIKAGYIHLYWAHIPEAATSSSRSQGCVLLLNGASSAGKTSLAHAFQQLSPCPVMVFSIDLFLPICGRGRQSVAATIDDTRLPLIEAFHAGIAASARAGAFVIVDHVIGEHADWFDDLKTRLGSLPLKTVKVLCRKEILASRESERKDRKPDLPHALRQEQTIHNGMCYDLEIDTSEDNPENCARDLLAQLAQNNFLTANTFQTQS